MACSIKSPIVNYILYVCNAVFAIFGFVLIVIGITMIKKIGDFTNLPNASDVKTFPTLVIILGFFIVAVAIFGSFGIYVENTIFLTIYAVITLIIFALQISLTIWVFVRKNHNAKDELVHIAWRDNYPEYGYPMDILQIQFNCCGLDGAHDYLLNDTKVPNSCCGDWILVDCPDKVYLAKPGCQLEFYNFWQDNYNIIGFVGIVLAVTQLFALLFSFYFIRVLRQSSISH